MVGYILRNTLSDHGTVNRGVATTDARGHLATVNERLKIAKRDGQVSYLDEAGEVQPLDIDSFVSMNFWGFHPSIFKRTQEMFHEFVHETAGQARAEFLIPEVVDQMIKSGEAVCEVLTSNDKWYGVTYQEDKPMVVEAFQELLRKQVYPAQLWAK
jgi:hypothetical protein